MFEFLYDLPVIIVAPAIIAALCLFAIGGLRLVHRRVLPKLRIQAEDSGFSGALMQGVMGFYGLAVALIAVNVFTTYSDVKKIVSEEAAALAALYRDVSGYPAPLRTPLQQELRGYVEYVIHEAWPLQRRGEIPGGGVERMNRLQTILIGYEPATESQKLLHAETLRAYNVMIQARRLRLDAATFGLPGIMWTVIVVGAVISLSTAFFFKVEDLRLHMILVALLAVFMGLVIFMILALDRPFRGDVGLRPEAYELIYNQLMKPAP